MSKRLTSQIRDAAWMAVLVFAILAPIPAFAQLAGHDGGSMPTLLYDWQFAADKSLTARISQGIVFTLDENGGTGRYKLEGSTYRFCLKGGGGYYTSIKLETRNGHTVSRQLDQDGCIEAEVPKGVLS